MKLLHLFFIGLLLSACSCSTVYYKMWETVGQEKRDLLKSNISSVKEDQEEIQEEFKDTLEKIRHEYSFDGGKLEETYDQLSSDYEDAASLKEQLSQRIEKVETIAEDLFAEWLSEAHQIKSRKLRHDSLNKRHASMKKFNAMLAKMKNVEKSVDPILVRFNDQVLYLKHNLNAKAVGAFKVEFQSIEKEFKNLTAKITASSQSANDFIKNM